MLMLFICELNLKPKERERELSFSFIRDSQCLCEKAMTHFSVGVCAFIVCFLTFRKVYHAICKFQLSFCFHEKRKEKEKEKSNILNAE